MMTENKKEKKDGMSRVEAIELLKSAGAVERLRELDLMSVECVWRLTGSKMAAAEMRRRNAPQRSAPRAHGAHARR